jgi:hypothetical protein
MIVCSKCGKENQDHYKFCLGCGSELAAAAPAKPPRAAAPTAMPAPAAPAAPAGAAPRKTSRPPADAPVVAVSPTPPAGVPQVGDADEFTKPAPTPRGPTAASASAAKARPPTGEDALRTTSPEAPQAPSGATGACPTCGTPNPKEFVFCGNCGARLQQAAAPRTMNIAAKAKPAEARALGRLGLIRPDGTEGGQHVLREVESIIGRGTGALFDHDSYLSPQHARFTFQDGEVVLEDIGSLNGVFVKISNEEALGGSDIFRIGQELLRFDAILDPQLLEDGTEIMGSPNPGYWGRLSVIMGPGLDGSAFPLMGEEMVLGRERGDILFSDDGYVSGTHAKICVREDGYFLNDLGSSNGTFIRITQPRKIGPGTFVLMGQQLFRFEQL